MLSGGELFISDLLIAGYYALGDLAVDGGPRQADAGENGFHGDDTVWAAKGKRAFEDGCASVS
jgi:hypothetical protein